MKKFDTTIIVEDQIVSGKIELSELAIDFLARIFAPVVTDNIVKEKE